MNPEKRLGRGLDSLISRTALDSTASGRQEAAAPEPQSDRQATNAVPLDQIRVNPDQPRKVMDESALAGLAESIRVHGLLQAIVVRRVPGGYELVAGERRLRAARQAGLTTVPISLVEAEGVRSLELALIENIQRENLGPLEEADAYEALIHRTNWTHQQLAERMGRSRAAITNALRLLDLPTEAKVLLQSGQISAGLARAVLGLEDKNERSILAQRAATEGLSVRDVERLVREAREPVPDATEASKDEAQAAVRDTPERPPNTLTKLDGKKSSHYVDELRNLYGTKVSIVENEGRGEVRFAFFTTEDRDRLLHALLTADPEA